MQKKSLRIILGSAGILLLFIVPVLWSVSNLNNEPTINLEVRKVGNNGFPLHNYPYNNYRLFGDKVLQFGMDYDFHNFYLGWYNLSTNEDNMISEGSGWVFEYCIDSNYVVWSYYSASPWTKNRTYKETIYVYDFSKAKTDILLEHNHSIREGIGNIQLINGYLYFTKRENQSLFICKFDIPNKQIIESIEIDYKGYIGNLEMAYSGAVWSDLNGTSIYYLDLISKKEELIAEEENGIDSLRIYGNHIVWNTYNGNDSIIKIYDIDGKNEKAIVRKNRGMLQGSLQIYDRYIVWIDVLPSNMIYLPSPIIDIAYLITGYCNKTIKQINIYLYYLKTNNVHQLTDDSKLKTDLSIYKNHILYVQRERDKDAPKSRPSECIDHSGDLMYGTIREENKSNLFFHFF